MASRENGKLGRVGQEVITHSPYLMLFALKTAECLMEWRGQCKDISDLLLLVETLYSCFLFLYKFLCAKDHLGPIFHLHLLLLNCVK